MTTLFRNAAAGLVLLLSAPAYAQIAGCPDALGDQADKAVGDVKTWTAFEDWYRHYAVCDDGDTAESMDSMTANLLGGKWPDLMRHAAKFQNNPGLQKFLIRHINAVGLTRARATALEARATSQCSPTNGKLCCAIAQAAKTTVLENSPN